MAPLRIGMVGGGEGSFIGPVHRMALALDGIFELVAGCFGRQLENTRQTGARLGLDPDRCYPDFETMARLEAALPKTRRLQAVAIVTPNHLHVPASLAFLERGFHVILEKPLSTTLEDAERLVSAVQKSGLVFALCHNYTAYPMVREARTRVQRGDLGAIRKVQAEYLQGWLASPLERQGHKQALWRTDPARSGPTGALGDIGTHAFNLLEHVSGLKVSALQARLRQVVPGRLLDDDATVMLELGSGASGLLWASQVAFGRENGLELRLFGSQGALEWRQEYPEDLWLTGEDGGRRLLRRATQPLTPAGRSRSRLTAGHPEGYIESFANLYRSFGRAIQGLEDLEAPFPSALEGLREMRFLFACLESHQKGCRVPL